MKVVFVVGTTASGKSSAALSWARELGGAIVNCDSIQCYKSVDIGSAKPTQLERESLPHCLFDYVEEGETLTAGTYARDFFKTLHELEVRETPVVFVVGGTGFYFQAIEKGMFEIGPAGKERIAILEARLRDGEGEKMWRELLQIDPESAAKISHQDHYRLVRALEVYQSHGKNLSQIRNEFDSRRIPFPYPLLKLGLKGGREELLSPITRRTEDMLGKGWLEETEALLRRGHEEWAPLSSVGYRECVDYILGRSAAKNLSELTNLIVTSTLQLAKKQRTWFSRDKEIKWLNLSTAKADGQRLLDAF